MSEENINPENKTKYYLFLDGEISPRNLFRLIDVLDEVEEERENVSIDFIVNSPGGYGNMAFKMARVLREKCSILNSIIPFYAKSAATLLVLASDVIIMGSKSELGPLDTQIEHPNEGKRISALDHVGSLEYLSGVGIDLGFTIGSRARQEIQLSRLDSIKIGLQFAQEYIKPLAAQLDPTLLYQSHRGLKEAEIYSIELLKDYMFVNEHNATEKAKIIASQLVWNYYTHGFVIDFHEAKHLGLNIENDTNYLHKDMAWALVENALQDEEETVCLWSEEEFIEFEKRLLNNNEDGDEEDEKRTSDNLSE